MADYPVVSLQCIWDVIVNNMSSEKAQNVAFITSNNITAGWKL